MTGTDEAGVTVRALPPPLPPLECEEERRGSDSSAMVTESSAVPPGPVHESVKVLSESRAAVVSVPADGLAPLQSSEAVQVPS